MLPFVSGMDGCWWSPKPCDGELRVWLVRCPQSVEGNVISFVFPHLPGEGCLILRDGDLLPTFLLPSSPRLLAISSSQWASQDHICQHLPSPDRSGFARPQVPALENICQVECQIECQKECQIECLECQIDCKNTYQVECQIECQNICQIEC